MEENNNIEEVKTFSYKTTTINIPENYKPISAWGYVGYQLLFSLPIIGIIMLLVFAFGDGNVNLKNFARSYLLFLLIGIILSAIVLILFAAFGIGFTSFAKYN